MKKRRIHHRTIHQKTAAALTLSLLVVAACAFPARANAVDDAKQFLSGLGKKVSQAVEDSGVGPAVAGAYDTVTDFIFTYETQPDDNEMESLARSWAITAWLEDEEKQESGNTYYLDNHTFTMVKDLTKIGRGYNQKKTPEGSYLNGKHTGILKAVVNTASVYTVEWVDYDNELNIYLARKIKEKRAAETETE